MKGMRHLLYLGLLLTSVGCGSSGVKNESPGVENATSVPSTTSKHCDSPFAGAGKLQFDPGGWKTNFCENSVPFGEIRSGGLPRDGIPPIDSPKFTSVENANAWIRDVEPVIALERNGVARAYPLQVLIWHEIVNDVIGGEPVAITFCPLCYAAVVFRRPEINGERLSFGTTGNLRKSDMVMWDRETESWWQQFDGVGIVGDLTGRRLEALPTAIVSWESFKRGYPRGEVLSRDTGIKRAYGRNPYVGYDDVSKEPFLYQGKVGDEMPPMAHVVGVDTGTVARAYPVELLRTRGALNDSLGAESVAVFWKSGSASALDAETIATGMDAGSTGVFLREIDGRALTFRATQNDDFTDAETGTRWNVLGHAVSGPLMGRRLKPVPHHRVFWFAWSAFVADRGSLFRESPPPN